MMTSFYDTTTNLMVRCITGLAGNVGNMSATCRRRANLSPILTRHACRGRHILALTQDFCVGDCNYKKSTYKLNNVGKLENTHRKHRKSPKMIHRRPILQRLSPISMGRAAVPPANGAADPYGPAQGARGWVWRRNVWGACLGRQKQTHQQSERHIVNWH